MAHDIRSLGRSALVLVHLIAAVVAALIVVVFYFRPETFAVYDSVDGVAELQLRGSGVRVTLIEPGITDTPFFDTPKPDGLRAADVARAVVYALQQPPGVDLHEMVILPTPPREDA